MDRVNFWRGLFRLWIVSSVLWVGFVGAVSYKDIREGFISPILHSTTIQAPDGHLYEVETEVTGESAKAHPIDLAQLSDEQLKDYRDMLAREYHPWRKVARTTAIAFGVPAVVFILGFALRWAFAGFRR